MWSVIGATILVCTSAIVAWSSGLHCTGEIRIASPVFLCTVSLLTSYDTDYSSHQLFANMATGSLKIPVPIYDPNKNYELFKNELLLWAQVCNLDDKKKGGAVALALPNTDKCSLRTTILEKLSLDELTSQDGLTKLITELDSLLGKDDLEDALSKFEEFEDYSRKSENVKEYIRVFDSKYTKVKNLGVKLPESVLAFKLLRNANISSEDKKLVMTGMDYSKKDDLYTDAKSALKKY